MIKFVAHPVNTDEAGQTELDPKVPSSAANFPSNNFNEFARENSARLVSLARAKLRACGNPDSDLAHDIAQEVWKSAGRSLDLSRDPNEINSFLNRAVGQRTIDALRRTRNREASLDQEPDYIKDQIRSAQLDPVEDLISAESQQAVRNAIEALDPEHHAVISRKFFLEMTVPEIAQDLNLSVPTVRSRIDAGLRSLSAGLIKTYPRRVA